MKRILIISLLLFIISIGCVSASEDVNNTLSLDDNNELISTTGTFSELQDLIDDAEEEDTITLTKDYKGSSEITIDKSLIIDGAGHEIDASGQSRIFNIYSEVLLYNITFVNGNVADDVGGAVFTTSYIEIEECLFISNSAEYGGAVYAKDEIYVKNSTFYGNSADYGGAIYSADYLNAYNVLFMQNSAEIGSGAVRCYFADINYCGFLNNTAGEYGGSIFATGALDLEDSIFVGYNEVDFLDYYSYEKIDSAFLYLKNNTMEGVNSYDIWFESEQPITSQINLNFVHLNVEKGDEIEIASLLDDNGNIINMDNITLKIYKGKNLVDEKTLNYTDGYYYTCNLDDGTYKVTGSISSDYATKVTVSDGELIVGNPITKKTPTVTTTSQKNKAEVILTATIEPANATGTVTFYLNGKNYQANVKNGKATKTLSNLADGTYTVKTTYNGDDNYNIASAKDISFEIASTGINIEAADLTKYYKGPERFTVNVSDSEGNSLSGKTVTIKINGNSYDRTTDSNGVAGMNINLPSDTYTAEVECEGEKATATVTVKSTIDGDDVTKIFKNGTQYYAKCTDSNGKIIKNAAIEFNINGVFYTRYTNDEGIVRMNINLAPGKYIITGKNPETGEQSSNTINVLSSITDNHDITKYYKNATRYTMKILDDEGNPAKAGVKVTFNINGVFYERASDDNGNVGLNINLAPGDYIITADYNGLKVSNKIKVLSILSGKDLNMEYKDGSRYEVTLLDGQGNLYSGQTVKFNINGVFYDRVTDANGVAGLNINLNPGTYIITSSFNGQNIANRITIGSANMITHKSYGFTIDIAKDVTYKDYNNPALNSQRCDLKYPNGEYVSVSPSTNNYASNLEFYLRFGYTNIGYLNEWAILNNPNQASTHEAYVLISNTNPSFLISSNDLALAKPIATSLKIVPGCVPDDADEGDDGDVITYKCGDFNVNLPESATIELTTDEGDACVFTVGYEGNKYQITEDAGGIYSAYSYIQMVINAGGSNLGNYNGWTLTTYNNNYMAYTDHNSIVFGVLGPQRNIVQNIIDSIEFV